MSLILIIKICTCSRSILILQLLQLFQDGVEEFPSVSLVLFQYGEDRRLLFRLFQFLEKRGGVPRRDQSVLPALNTYVVEVR